MSGNTFYFVENDTLPQITGVYKNSDGTPVDITGYTIELHIKYDTPREITADLTDPTNGEFKFNWVAGDLKAGTWEAEIEIKNADGKILTAQKADNKKKLSFVISEEIA